MHVAIVDGYSTGSVLAKRLRDANVECLHIQSREIPLPYLQRTFSPSCYKEDIGFENDLQALAGKLAERQVTHVVAGAESGVSLAEKIAQILGLETNRPALQEARRNKQLMAAIVQDAGLAVPVGKVCGTDQDAVLWYRESGYPDAVLKPVSSAASDNVHFCCSEDEVRQAAQGIQRKANVFGQSNTLFMAQERLNGEEYFVNTVSKGGCHKTAEIWKYYKRTSSIGTPIYDFEEPVRVTSAEGMLLRDFTYGVLDALGVTDTPAHTEVMLTAHGPVFIETGARLGGGAQPHIVEKFCGTSQVNLFVAALLNDSGWADFDELGFNWSGSIRNVDFINYARGLANPSMAAVIDLLESAVCTVSHTDPYSLLEPTTDLTSSPGHVYLASEDRAVVERDYKALRRWESLGLHTVSTADLSRECE